MALNFYIKQNDTSPTIRATLRGADGVAFNLRNSSIAFRMRRAIGSGALIQGSAEIFDAGEGVVEYSWASGDTAVSGEYRAEFEVTYSDGKVETFPNVGGIEVTIEQELG